MRDDDRVRILHMMDAAGAVAQFVAERSRDDLDRDRMTENPGPLPIHAKATPGQEPR